MGHPVYSEKKRSKIRKGFSVKVVTPHDGVKSLGVKFDVFNKKFDDGSEYPYIVRCHLYDNILGKTFIGEARLNPKDKEFVLSEGRKLSFERACKQRDGQYKQSFNEIEKFYRIIDTTAREYLVNKFDKFNRVTVE